MPRVGPHEFHVLVAGAKLQEHPHLGKMWVVMPSGIGEAPTTYLIPFEEELADGEVVAHQWPVTPFQVSLANHDSRPCFAEVKADGKTVKSTLSNGKFFLKPGQSRLVKGFNDGQGTIKELLFSLPRHLNRILW